MNKKMLDAAKRALNNLRSLSDAQLIEKLDKGSVGLVGQFLIDSGTTWSHTFSYAIINPAEEDAAKLATGIEYDIPAVHSVPVIGVFQALPGLDEEQEWLMAA